MVFLTSFFIPVTNRGMESFRQCPSVNDTESRTGCGNDETTGVETSPTGNGLHVSIPSGFFILRAAVLLLFVYLRTVRNEPHRTEERKVSGKNQFISLISSLCFNLLISLLIFFLIESVKKLFPSPAPFYPGVYRQERYRNVNGAISISLSSARCHRWKIR